MKKRSPSAAADSRIMIADPVGMCLERISLMPTDCIVKAPKQAQNSSHVSGFNLQHIILLLCSLEAISSFVSPKVPTKNGLGCQSNRKTVTASRELLAAVHNIGELCRDLEHQCWYRPIQFPGICGGYRPCCAAHDRHFFGVSAKLPPKNMCLSKKREETNELPQINETCRKLSRKTTRLLELIC